METGQYADITFPILPSDHLSTPLSYKELSSQTSKFNKIRRQQHRHNILQLQIQQERHIYHQGIITGIYNPNANDYGIPNIRNEPPVPPNSPPVNANNQNVN